MRKPAWLLILLCIGVDVVAEEPTRSVTVNGIGAATATADRATLRMSIVARDPEVANAQAKAGEVTANVLKLTDQLEIERDKVDTTAASVRPDYQYDRDSNQQTLRGYIAERQMRIDLDDLEKLGLLTEGAVTAGVNQVMPPELDSSERRDAHRRALRAAAEDARANARELADTLGVTLGDVITISTAAPPFQPGPQMRTYAVGAAADAETAATYDPGQLHFAATVTAVFALDE
jgi:uncharacterized protein YggE